MKTPQRDCGLPNRTIRRGRAINLYDFEVRTIDGETLKLDNFKGRVLLIVNVASRCMFTRQYRGLEDLYRRWKEKGFAVLGFPCNQFGRQEPGDEAAIKGFCAQFFNVTFPMFAKIQVNGGNADPLYSYLKSARRGIFWTRSIKWNFTKFLVDKDGTVVKRFGPPVSPRRIEKWLPKLLNG